MKYYPFNIGDYRKKTGHLSLLEHGIYRILLDSYYDNEGPLEADDAKLMRTHCIRSEEEKSLFSNVISDFFYLEDGFYHNTEADEVIAKILEKSDKARASAEKRWAAKKAKAMRTHSESNANGILPNTHNPKPNTQDTNKKPLRGDAAWFDSFWSAFDTRFGDKGSKKNALAQWKKINPDQQLYDEIMAALVAQIRQKEMQQAAGVFCPNFKNVERWLKDRRWEDEISNRIVKPADTRDKAARAADEAFGPDSEPGFYEGDFARIEQDGPFE